MINGDQLAAEILLSDRPEAEKQTLLRRVSRYLDMLTGGHCPECQGTHCEDNGARGAELTFLCTGCGHQWMPVEEERSVEQVLARD